MRNKRLKQGDMKQNIYNWYSSVYPNDYQLDKINRVVTFDDMNDYRFSLYDLIGYVDSLVIDRIYNHYLELKKA